MSISPTVREALGNCEGEGEGERGERGKRGKRGHRGHDGRDGRDGATGPTGRDGATGPTGPTGMTGPAVSIGHVQASTRFVGPLVPNSTANVLTCPLIAGPAGSIFEITGMVNWTCLGKPTSDAPLFDVRLKQDGVVIATCFVTPGFRLNANQSYDFLVAIPIDWLVFSDGLPHTFSIDVNVASNTSQQVQDCVMFVNNLP